MQYLALLQLAAPHAILVVAALAVLGADLGALTGLQAAARRRICGMLAVAGCGLSAAWILAVPPPSESFGPTLVSDVLTRWAGVGVLLLAGFSILLGSWSEITEHVGEFYGLVLVAVVGMLFLIGTEDLLVAFIALELTSLCLYALTGFSPSRPESAEAALKYFLFGAISAAITLFGISLLYGLTGVTGLPLIASALAGHPSVAALPLAGMAHAPLVQVALVMTAAGFAFKVAAAPFHLWAPDVYQGAPVPATALVASASKVAGFFILTKVMAVGFGGDPTQGTTSGLVLLAVLAAVSIIVGNLAALAQIRVKRLLAYSAVAHTGYVLLGVMTPESGGMASVIFYTVTYGLATIGVLGVIGLLEQQGADDSFSALAGLCQRSMFLSVCLLVCVLSLAGIPPLSGFFAKFWVFSVALGAGEHELRLVWLVLLALAGSCVSLYYYVKILKEVFLRPAPSDEPVVVPLVTRIAVGASALGVVLLGCFPEGWVSALLRGL